MQLVHAAMKRQKRRQKPLWLKLEARLIYGRVVHELVVNVAQGQKNKEAIAYFLEYGKEL